MQVSHKHGYSALRNIAQGYAFVILGVIAAMFLCSGVFDGKLAAFWMPVHALSVALLVLGGWWWWRMPPLTANWLRWTEQFMIAALLQAYMIPFIAWWRKSPQVPFFAINAIIALIGIAWLLLMLGAVIAETGTILGDRTLKLEGHVGAWLAPVLVIFPLAFAAIGNVIFFLRTGLALNWNTLRIGLLWPAWLDSLVLFAPVLLLAIAVEARLRCIRALRSLEST